MILPDNLHPLPVPQDESGRRAARGPVGFVNEADVRQLLVGPLALGRRPTCYDGRDGGFAGPGEIHDSPFLSLVVDEIHDQDPPKSFVPPAVGPRARVRRVPAPRPRSAPAEPAALGPRRWALPAAMLGLGVLVGCGLFSFRARVTPGPAVPAAPSVVAPHVPEEGAPAIAAADAALR